MEENNMNANTQSNQAPVAQDSEPPESERDYDREYCPGCGAKHTHWNEARRHYEWLGLGETDWCISCGADYEHSASSNKKPLTERRPELLLQTARNVEHAYTDISRSMTQEQIVQNREYFKRLIGTIASSNLYHIPDRVEKSEANARWEELRGEASTLMEELYGMGRFFYKNQAGDFSESELAELIDDMKAKLAEKAKAA